MCNFRVGCNSQCNADREGNVFLSLGFDQIVPNGLGNIIHERCGRNHTDEFVSAISSGKGRGIPDGVFDCNCNHLNQLVSVIMAEDIIRHFQVIDVNEDDRIIFFSVIIQHIQLSLQILSVAERRQIIRVSKHLQMLLLQGLLYNEGHLEEIGCGEGEDHEKNQDPGKTLFGKPLQDERRPFRDAGSRNDSGLFQQSEESDKDQTPLHDVIGGRFNLLPGKQKGEKSGNHHHNLEGLHPPQMIHKGITAGKHIENHGEDAYRKCKLSKRLQVPFHPGPFHFKTGVDGRRSH